MTPDSNPYRPPQSRVEPVDDASTRPLAGRGRRFCTFLVDYLGVYVMGAVVGVSVGLAFGDSGIATLEKIPSLLLGCLLMFAYYAFFEGLWARTPGKWIFGTKVVDAQGGRPSLRVIAQRTLCRFIPFEALTFFGETGLHDRFSGTRVVHTR